MRGPPWRIRPRRGRLTGPIDEVLAAANGPATLGRQAPRSGLLREGFDADILAIDGDPLGDISLLADPSRITAVWQAGTLVKDLADRTRG
ncbi:hypothetical protein [Actinomadura sp. B10D3]|uniref:hypothetical protein n=1 Tax=Actinomadura sp. B10D3 TaxID=3153557 RepID=UPI00325E8753